VNVSRDEMKEHLAGGGLAESGGLLYRGGDRLPEGVAGGVLLRDGNGRLTRAGMERAIRQNGSVLYRDKIIERAEELPDEADLVKHDERQKEALAASFDAQIAELTRQRAKLDHPEMPGPLRPHETEREVATQRVAQGGQFRDVPVVPDVRLGEAPPGPQTHREALEAQAKKETPGEQHAGAGAGEAGPSSPAPSPPPSPPGGAEVLVPSAEQAARPRRGRPSRVAEAPPEAPKEAEGGETLFPPKE
jgi:hypothetical protein